MKLFGKHISGVYKPMTWFKTPGDDLMDIMVRKVTIQADDDADSEDYILRLHWRVNKSGCTEWRCSLDTDSELFMDMFLGLFDKHKGEVARNTADEWAFIIPPRYWNEFDTETQSLLFIHNPTGKIKSLKIKFKELLRNSINA